MGVQVSSNTSFQQLGFSGNESIQSQYYQKIYAKSKKTMKKFTVQLKSIMKRISYLPYSWAQQFRELLQRQNQDRLYSQYKQVLKENCLKEGRNQTIFYEQNIVNFFQRSFIQNKKELRYEDSLEKIVKFAEEGKAFLMVLEWLHQLTKTEQQNFFDPRQGWVSQIQERVCAGLLDLAQNYFQGRQINRMRKAHSLGIINNQKILFALSKLKKRISFAEREGVLLSVESMLGEDQDTFQRGLELICQIFGKAAVLAHIFVVQEMGRVKIARAWRFLVRETGAESADSK